MHAERLILETDGCGKLKQVPLLPANKKLEAIFLVITENEQTNLRRRPHPDIAEQTNIMGNIIETVPEAEWDLPK